MLQAKVGDFGQLVFAEDFTDGVVGGVEDYHFGFGRDSSFQLGEVDTPVCGR